MLLTNWYYSSKRCVGVPLNSHFYILYLPIFYPNAISRIMLYLLMLSASKAFDRLRHIELFKRLSERNMCPLVRRLLFNLYGNHQFQILWNNCLSDMYNMTKGVKQCVVLSPILFTMYIDGLFYELKRAGVRCHINR